MTRIEHDKIVVRKMIELYCHHHLKANSIPPDYQHLIDYTAQRLEHCRFGEQKRSCKSCPVHCYAPKEREDIRRVMLWSGPRMIFYYPKDAILHLLKG